jgi:hypothetical protein
MVDRLDASLASCAQKPKSAMGEKEDCMRHERVCELEHATRVTDVHENSLSLTRPFMPRRMLSLLMSR